jgi:hypothetical protein
MSDNVIHIFRPTKKELDKWFGKKDEPKGIGGDGGYDETSKYSGKLKEAMEKYGHFKGHFRSKK